jgi:hypothetical protein
MREMIIVSIVVKYLHCKKPVIGDKVANREFPKQLPA